jgi:hypothetical protein
LKAEPGALAALPGVNPGAQLKPGAPLCPVVGFWGVSDATAVTAVAVPSTITHAAPVISLENSLCN